MKTGLSPATFRRSIRLRSLGLHENPFPLIQFKEHAGHALVLHALSDGFRKRWIDRLAREPRPSIRSGRTNRLGRAVITRRLRASGNYFARATKSGLRSGRTIVRIRRRRP